MADIFKKIDTIGWISAAFVVGVTAIALRHREFSAKIPFGPYLAGPDFTLADCAAYVTLPLVALGSKIIYGEDFLAAAGVDWKPYAKLVGERPTAQKVAADRKADQERTLGAKS